MRAGNQATMLFNSKGRLFAIATGSDHTSEHEWGSQPLMEGLTGQPQPTRAEIGAKLRARQLKQAPALRETLRITHDLDRIHYVEGEHKGQPVAALGYDVWREELNLLNDIELGARSTRECEVFGAWSDRDFGFRVLGQKNVAALRAFAQALKAGKGIFAGRFLGEPRDRLSGVIIAIEELLRPEHRGALKEAEHEFAEDVRLHSLARTEELKALTAKLPRDKYIFNIWPVWVDKQVGSIAYAMNPGNGLDAPYYGPYTFEQLEPWLKGGAQGPLRPIGTPQPA